MTPTELRIARLVIDGASTGQIAEKLHISKHQVWKHRHLAIKRLGARSFLHAIIICVKRGELEIA